MSSKLSKIQRHATNSEKLPDDPVRSVVEDVEKGDADNRSGTETVINYKIGSYKEQFKNEVAEYITKLIFNKDNLKVAVVNSSGNENELLTKMLKDTFKGRFLRNLKHGVFKSLRDGEQYIRVSGSILTQPKIYNLTKFIDSVDESTGVLYESLFQFPLLAGTYSSIATELYVYEKQALKTQIYQGAITSFSEENTIKLKKDVKNSRKRGTEWRPIKKVPYVNFNLILDKDNKATDIFWNLGKDLEMLDKAYRKLNIYLDSYNFHIFPISELLEKYDDGQSTKAIFDDWIVEVKDSDNALEGTEQPFSIFEPQQDNLIKVFSIFDKVIKMALNNIGLQFPTFENANQKSEYEIKILKFKEQLVKSDITTNLNQALDKVFKIIMPDALTEAGFKAITTNKPFDIKDEELEQKRKEYEFTNQIIDLKEYKGESSNG